MESLWAQRRQAPMRRRVLSMRFTLNGRKCHRSRTRRSFPISSRMLLRRPMIVSGSRGVPWKKDWQARRTGWTQPTLLPTSRMLHWSRTQRPFANRDELAAIFHLSESDVRVIVPDTGSAYGGKHTSDAAIEAARLARAARRPVKVVWTREEEFTWAYFRPAGVIEVKSGIASDATLTAWDFHNYHSGASGIDTPYVVVNQRTEYHPVPLILRSGSYRGLAATANHFARETHMDALTRAASMDPLDFR